MKNCTLYTSNTFACFELCFLGTSLLLLQQKCHCNNVHLYNIRTLHMKFNMEIVVIL